MEYRKYRLKVTFVTPLLGTQPQKNVATEYITSKAKDPVTGELPEDEVSTLPEALEKGTTAFHKVDGQPILYNYIVKGFIKEAGKVFNGLGGVTGLRSKIDNLLFVQPRQILLHLPEGGKIEFCERSLRAETPMGPRTALMRSEMVPVGTWFTCNVKVYNGEKKKGELSEKLLRELLSYMEDKGFGQWRNSGAYGQAEFEFEEIGESLSEEVGEEGEAVAAA